MNENAIQDKFYEKWGPTVDNLSFLSNRDTVCMYQALAVKQVSAPFTALNGDNTTINALTCRHQLQLFYFILLLFYFCFTFVLFLDLVIVIKHLVLIVLVLLQQIQVVVNHKY